MMQVRTFTEGIRISDYGINSGYIKNRAREIVGLIDYDFPDCNIIISDDLFIRSINSEYRNRDKPTDVISFPADDQSLPAQLQTAAAAEVYISIERAAAQAGENGISLKDEIKQLLVHGLLHVAGYDHEASAAEEKRMREAGDSILKKI